MITFRHVFTYIKSPSRRQAMSDAKPSKSNISGYSDDRTLTSILDDIIRIKRQRENKDVCADITIADRKALLEGYKHLEELRDNQQGRLLLEYSRGLRTILEEVEVVL